MKSHVVYVTVRLDLLLRDGEDPIDAVNEMDYKFTALYDDTIEDTEIVDIELKETK